LRDGLQSSGARQLAGIELPLAVTGKKAIHSGLKQRGQAAIRRQKYADVLPLQWLQ
jgi:hypothetical protein